MNAPEQKITREELHRLVWTRTFVKLATELGYTYPELAAICEDLNIPRPCGGYWNRLELGTAEAQEPLPPATPGKPTEIPRGLHKASKKPAAKTFEAPEPLTNAEKSESESGKNNTTPPDVAADKPDPTHYEPIRISRAELYQKVWNTPLSKLAAELNTSYVELIRICGELNVPRPERDHWTRLQLKLPVTVKPLPAPESSMASKGLIWRKGSLRQKPVILADGHHSETEQDRPVANDGAFAAKEIQVVEKPAVLEYTREQLHEAIWSKPCVKLAAELGISDVALAKTCRRMGIPRPPRGYWARIRAALRKVSSHAMQRTALVQ